MKQHSSVSKNIMLHVQSPNQRRKRRIRNRAKHSRHKEGPPFMGTLGVGQNIPVSNTELSSSLGIYYRSPPSEMDKLIHLNSRAVRSPPKMSLLHGCKLCRMVLCMSRTHVCSLHWTKVYLCYVHSSLFSEQNFQLAETFKSLMTAGIQYDIQYLNSTVSTPGASK